MAVKIRNRVFLRVFILFASLVLAIMLFFVFMVIPMQKNALLKTMYTQGVTVSRSIIQSTSDAIISNDFGFIVEHNIEVLNNNPSIRYVVVSPMRGGSIKVAQSGWRLLDKLETHLNLLQTEQIEEKIRYKEWLVEDDNFLYPYAFSDLQWLPIEFSTAEGYHFVYPIKFSGIKWGWLHIEFSTNEYNTYIREMYLQLVYISAISLVLIIFIGYFFARWVTFPVLTISNLAMQVANGNLEVRSPIKRQDEIGMLSNSFNQMVDALQLNKQYLENYNQQLELEVTKRTLDLDALNRNLDKKVKDEVQQRQEQEQLLIHQSRLAAMGEMIGAIAHQWRQPLNALSLVIQNQYISYQMGKLDEQVMMRHMEKSERLINKMSTTIDDFRNFFKPNKNAENFNIKMTLQATVSLLGAQFKNHNIIISIDCSDDLIIKGFQGEFSQVILNLLNNAKDILLERHTQTPIIAISAQTVSQGIHIIIADNGGGIPEDILHKIYDPYFTTKEEGKGTGIGLYMSKMIVENNMMGKLSAVNTTEGANFIIEVPLLKTHEL